MKEGTTDKFRKGLGSISKMKRSSRMALALVLLLIPVLAVLSITAPIAAAPEAGHGSGSSDDALIAIDDVAVPLAPGYDNDYAELTRLQTVLILAGTGLLFYTSFRLLIRRKIKSTKRR